MRVDRSTNPAAYTSPISGIDAQRMRTRHFAPDKAQGQKFFALTSYDALTADIFDEAGTDLLLVGNSAAYDGIELRNKGASEDFISRLPTCTPDEIGYSPW